MRLQKIVADLRTELAQESILRRQEEDLRFIPFLQQDLLKAKEDLLRMTLNKEKHKSEFEILEKRMQEFRSQNRSLKAQISDKGPELSYQVCLPWQHEEELRSIPSLKADLLNATHKL
jgi:hypothetical protein